MAGADQAPGGSGRSREPLARIASASSSMCRRSAAFWAATAASRLFASSCRRASVASSASARLAAERADRSLGRRRPAHVQAPSTKAPARRRMSDTCFDRPAHGASLLAPFPRPGQTGCAGAGQSPASASAMSPMTARSSRVRSLIPVPPDGVDPVIWMGQSGGNHDRRIARLGHLGGGRRIGAAEETDGPDRSGCLPCAHRRG